MAVLSQIQEMVDSIVVMEGLRAHYGHDERLCEYIDRILHDVKSVLIFLLNRTPSLLSLDFKAAEQEAEA